MEQQELEKNIQIFKNDRPEITPCEMFINLKKSVPLSVFIRVYPFNELVDCGLEFTLEELMELKRLYYTLDEGDQQLYIDSLRRLQEMIIRIKSNKIPGSYGKGFQSWKEQVAANQEIKDVLHNPEPRQEDIDDIAYKYYMENRIPSTPPVPPVPQSLFSKFKSLFSGGGRKTAKKMYQKKRSKSRSKKSRSKKSRSKSRSNK